MSKAYFPFLFHKLSLSYRKYSRQRIHFLNYIGNRKVSNLQSYSLSLFCYFLEYRWSLQQRLFRKNDTHSQLSYHTSVYVNQPLNTMVATAYGPNDTVAYVFKSFGNGWSLQAKLISWNSTEEPPYYNNDPSQRKPNPKNFTNPTLWGGTLLFSAENEVQIRTQYRNHSCMVIWMSDHYRDGWDTAVLTVRAPDGSNDTFHPHCDQVYSFFIHFFFFTQNSSLGGSF